MRPDYRTLKRRATEAQKDALVRHLREVSGTKPTLLQRLNLIVERRWPEWRLPAYGLAFASVLAFVVAGGVLMSGGAVDAPEIDDIEFEGSSAVVIESASHATTLIWLSDAEDVSDDDEDDDDEEDAAEDEEEVEDL